MPASPESYSGPSGGEILAGRLSSVPDNAAYKKDAKSLFYDPPLDAYIAGDNLCYTAERGSVAAPKQGFLWSGFGPHKNYVERYSQWKWANSGGDWLDINGTTQGSSPAWTFSATAVTSGSHTYTVDMTAAIQQCYSLGTWNAWIVRSATNRSWASRHSATPPTLVVTYSDGHQKTLKCLASTRLPSGTEYAWVGHHSIQTWGDNSVLEFERPTKSVTSATMQFTVDSHIAGAGVFNGFLANPPNNQTQDISGLSLLYTMDVGILSDTDVLFAQSYVDGSVITDFIHEPTIQHNLGYMDKWSPHMFGIGAANTNKLPYKWEGVDITNKFIPAGVGSIPIQLVDSSYADDGFEPFAPGVGALKVTTAGAHLPDGSIAASTPAAADLHSFFPEPICGLVDDIYVRYAIRFGEHPTEKVADLKMYRSGAGGVAEYAYPHGKTGIGPDHKNYFGGNNRNGGGNQGHSSRCAFYSCLDEDPDSIFIAWHSLDMWFGTEPPGTNNGNVYAGQKGPHGVRLKRNRWYQIEIRVKLNTWNELWDTDPTNDGVFQMWIDDTLVVDFTNFTYRQGPLNYTDPFDTNTSLHRAFTPTSGTYHPPFREIGHKGLWINDYQGGVVGAEHDQVVFYSQVVCATSRIGQVNFGPTTPPITIVGNAWTPNRNVDLTILDTDWEQLPLNQYVYVEAPTLLASGAIETPHYTAANGSDSALGIIYVWNGAAWDHNVQEMFITGGGHLATSSCETGIYRLKASTMLFDRVKDREPQSENGSWNYNNPPVFTPGENWQSVILKSSQHGAIHTYWGIVWVPPEVMAVIRGDSLNVSGGIFLTNIIRYVYDLDAREYVGVPSWRPAAGQEIDISDSAAFIDGSNFYGCHHSYDVWKWAAAGTQSTYWSPVSTGVFTKTFRSWGPIVSSHSVWGWLPERREVFGFYGSNSNGLLTFYRGRYGQAIDAAASNWGLYTDAITLTSIDDSHLDFNRDNLQSDNTPGGFLYGAASVYDHSTDTLYIQGITVGSLMYKVTGLATNTWTTEYVPGTGALEYSTNGVFGRMRMATLGGKKVMIRVSAVNKRTQVMRIS